MVYEIETDIYNIYAEFLVEADENGNFSLQEYISYDRSYLIEYYVNNYDLGNNAWGVEQASQTYFDKSIKDLNL